MTHTHTHGAGGHDHGHDHDHDHGHDHHHHDHDHDHGPERTFTVLVSSPSPTRRVLSVQVPAEEMERERAAVLAELRREIRIPGFRKGKVPDGYIQKHYADMVQNDAVRNLLPAVYEQALHRENLIPLGDPRFENVSYADGGLSFDAAIEIRPAVELKGYDRIAVEAARKPVEDADVERSLQSIREQLAVFQPVSRPATEADYLVIDYVPLTEAGAPEEASRAQDYPVALASDSLLAEFRTGLVGAVADETRRIQVRYPEDFGDAALAGTERTFEVRVKEIKEKLLPDVDDSFAKRIDPSLATVLELRLRIRQQLEAEAESRYQREVDDRIVGAILTENPFEVPEIMVENYLESLVEEDKRHRGTSDDDPERAEDIRRSFREAAVRTIQRYFVLDAVRRQESLVVTPAEFDERVRALAERLERPEAELRVAMEHPTRRRGLENDMLDEKAMAFLRTRATVRTA